MQAGTVNYFYLMAFLVKAVSTLKKNKLWAALSTPLFFVIQKHEHPSTSHSKNEPFRAGILKYFLILSFSI